MDLIDILRHRIEALAPGEHIAGLRAVLQHVIVATNHLNRGQTSGDDTAFTDAIYRSNQAFEGSLKEAYRVLAEKEPASVRPFDIETFLQTQNILRPRVLSQFSTYRKEWRNPSAHDYRLDFDEDEALLAIVSVSAFAIVLIDQISEKISFTDARTMVQSTKPVNVAVPLTDQVAEALITFHWQRPTVDADQPPRSSDLIGAVAGYLSATLTGSLVQTDVQIGNEQMDRADILVTHCDQKTIVEVKRGSFFRILLLGRRTVLERLRRYMELAKIKEGVLYTYRSGAEMKREEITTKGSRIIVVGPVMPKANVDSPAEQIVRPERG
jgi:hypothetical protein